jgi:hypothetical protein
MNMSRYSWAAILALAVVFVLGTIGCSGQSTQVAEGTAEAERVQEEDLPEPPPASSSSEGTRSQPQRVPEERTQSVTPPPPSTITLTIQEGTPLAVAFVDAITSETAMAGDRVSATLRQPLVVGDRVVFPADSRVEGRVTDVKPATKGFKDTSGAVAVSFDRITSPGGRSATIVAGFTKVAEGSGKKKAAIIGGSAAGGALLGKVLDKDAAGAAIIGGAIGTAVAGGTKGKEAVIEVNEELTVSLEQAVRVKVRR